VLIVTAIVGVSAAVRLWPVSVRERAPRVLASRALLIFGAAPVLPIPARVPLHEPERAEPVVAVPALPVMVAAVADVSGPAPEVPAEPRVAEPRAVVISPPADAFFLTSRRLDLPLAAPAVSYRSDPVIGLADDEPYALIELPAVAVTRVVTVAGRGIRTGVRATTAVFRAAF
jgi:hypothetical protein